MLTDVELFVATWFFAVVSIASIAILVYASMQFRMLKLKQYLSDADLEDRFRLSENGAKKAGYVTSPIAIVSTIVGAIVQQVNWISTTEYVYPSAMFRALSVPVSGFGIIFIFAVLLIYDHFVGLKRFEEVLMKKVKEDHLGS